MRICLQSTRFPPYNVGGEEIYVKRLYDSLSKDHIIYNINNTLNKKFKDKNIINLSSNCNGILYHFLSSLNLPYPDIHLKIIKIIKEINPDIIHINNPHTTFSTELFFLPTKYPKVWEIHDYSLFCLKGPNVHRNRACNRFDECWQCVHQQRLKLSEKKQSGPLRKIFILIWKLTNISLRNKFIYAIRKNFVRISLARVNKIICPSKNVWETCRKFGVDERKLVYLPYGIDLSGYKTKKIPEKKIVGFVGRLEKIKGCYVLIRAFKRVVDKIPGAILYIVGDGKEENNLRDFVNSLGLNKNVLFLGRKTEDELKDFYPSVQFLIVPSIWLETPALVTYEALASGRPVIASNIGDFPELIKDGENGFLFKPNDPEDLANKIIYLLKNPKEVNRLAKNALKTIKRYSTEEHNKKLIKVYKETSKKFLK